MVVILLKLKSIEHYLFVGRKYKNYEFKTKQLRIVIYFKEKIKWGNIWIDGMFLKIIR